ncbi:MAG: PD-(D/E)XK nuclease family protein [Acidobacteria bacterium]|nr:PD-(D/E)XK nuclease family protein [Acidobacteriota bacterium]
MTELPLVTTQSMLANFSRCPRKAMYAYVDKIKPRKTSRPLKMGAWFHLLLQARYNGQDWKDRHNELIENHEEVFFKEEWEEISETCARLMLSYLWYYQLEAKYGWKIIDVEFKLETTWPDGTPYWCKIDLLVEINGELWIVDHKLRTKLPSHLQRLLDSQGLLYPWAAQKNGLKIKGFIWNYIRMRAPAIPQIRRDGKLSERKIETDYPTLKKTLTEHKIDPRMYDAELRRLRAIYWRPGKAQQSPFFQRIQWELDPAVIRKKVIEKNRTHKRLKIYDFTNRDAVERIVDPSCDWGCDYSLLCMAELYGSNVEQTLRLHYRQADPLSYYTNND